jgi:hypothetical protein
MQLNSSDGQRDTIASRHESRGSLLQRQAVLVVVAGVLAITTVISTLLAMHFRGRARDERARLAQGAGTPSAAPRSSPVGTAVGSAPPLVMTSYDLSTGTARTTVYLAAAASQGGSSTTGQLLVAALIRGATNGTHYRLVGGTCDPTSPTDVVWAEGTADASGTAYLSGGARTLPKGDQYFMTIDPWQPAPGGNARLIPGLEGDFVLGEADPFVGHVNRIAGVGGGECFVGP